MKTKKVNNVKSANFMGRGVDGGDSGLTPNEGQAMGTYWGRAMRNPMGTMRDSSVGFRPVSKEQLGTPPKNLV